MHLDPRTWNVYKTTENYYRMSKVEAMKLMAILVLRLSICNKVGKKMETRR